LAKAFAGQAEAVMVIAGLKAFFTAVFFLAFNRRSWLGWPH
jgi:hypothetical protein